MNIGIIAWDEQEHESLTLEDGARKMGHTPLLFTLDDVVCSDRNGQLDVWVRGVPAAELDVIISRAQLRRETWDRDFEALMLLSNLPGVTILDPAPAFAAAESKLLGLQKLSQAGLPVIPTRQCYTIEAVKSEWERYGCIVVKPSFGYGGTDVERVDDNFEVKIPVLEDLLRRHKSLLVQPFVPHPKGDVRVTVVGDEVGFSFRRIPPPGKWKANVAMGASVAPFTPPPEMREIALRASRVMGITIAGLDIIERDGSYLIVELNTTPGWYPLSKAEQDEAVEKIISFAVQRALKGNRSGSEVRL